MTLHLYVVYVMQQMNKVVKL